MKFIGNLCWKITKTYLLLDGAWSDENDVADASSSLRPKIPNVSGFSDSSSASSFVASVRRQLPWSPCKRPSVLPIRKQTSTELMAQRRIRRIISPTSPTDGVVSSLSLKLVTIDNCLVGSANGQIMNFKSLSMADKFFTDSFRVLHSERLEWIIFPMFCDIYATKQILAYSLSFF